MYYCCGITDKGVMPHNEDAFFIHKQVVTEGSMTSRLPAPFLFGVSDGVSGELSGELASRLCLTMLSGIRFSRKVDMQQKLAETHERLAAAGAERHDTKNMQATFCGVGIDETEQLHFYNVGDSRLYRYRCGKLRQLSTDQSLVQMLYADGTITKEEQKTHRFRNIISPVMGNASTAPKPEICDLNEPMQYGDVLLLCTDGLSDYVPSSEIEEILAQPAALPRRLERLVRRAVENGGQDNITVVAVSVYD